MGVAVQEGMQMTTTTTGKQSAAQLMAITIRQQLAKYPDDAKQDILAFLGQEIWQLHDSLQGEQFEYAPEPREAQ